MENPSMSNGPCPEMGKDAGEKENGSQIPAE